MRQGIIFARSSTEHTMSAPKLKALKERARDLLCNEPGYFPVDTRILKESADGGSRFDLEVKGVAQSVGGSSNGNQLYTVDPEQIEPEGLMPSFQQKVFDIESLKVYDLRDFLIKNQKTYGKRTISYLQVTDVATYKIG